MKRSGTGWHKSIHCSITPIIAISFLIAMPNIDSGASTRPTPSGRWPFPNADIGNTRDAPASAISSENVSSLERAWTFKLTGSSAKPTKSGSLAATPIVQNGVVYFQDLDSTVYAVVLATGKLKWEYHPKSPQTNTLGPNGVAVADGRLFGASPNTAFALSAATGRSIWVDPLYSQGRGTFDIQPQVANGRVYLATTAGGLPGGGVLMALSESSGRLLWKFDSVPETDNGVGGAGGAWETPLVNSDGSVTYGVGNPYQSPVWAITNPSQLLYTDSDVNLDAATGILRWYYQGVTDDFKDFDMQASPMSATINNVPVVVGGGKMGFVYAMNAQTGALLWKTSVGEHNGHDDDSLQAMFHESDLNTAYTILPGSLGGVLTNMALAGNSVYVVTVDLPYTVTLSKEILGLNVPSNEKAATGDVEALNLDTGQVEWDTKVPHMPLGAATVSNDLLFTTLYTGVLIAFNRNTGAIVYRSKLPTSTNAAIAIAGNTVLVPAGGPTLDANGGNPQLLAYAVP